MCLPSVFLLHLSILHRIRYTTYSMWQFTILFIFHLKSFSTTVFPLFCHVFNSFSFKYFTALLLPESVKIYLYILSRNSYFSHLNLLSIVFLFVYISLFVCWCYNTRYGFQTICEWQMLVGNTFKKNRRKNLLNSNGCLGKPLYLLRTHLHAF